MLKRFMPSVRPFTVERTKEAAPKMGLRTFENIQKIAAESFLICLQVMKPGYTRRADNKK